MIKKASTLIVEFWIKNAIIKTDDKESYCYGMELILSTLINVAFMVILSYYVIGYPIAFIPYIAVYTPLRLTAGGYIEVEYKLGELSDEQYHKLREIVDNSLAMIEPYTVVLNPNPEEIVRRLEIRRATGTRKKRDQMCAREDNVDYVGKMNDEFIKIYSNKNVININNNEDEDIKKINDWINGTVLAQSKPF